MLRGRQFDYLKEKISNLTTALFFSSSDAVLKLPASLISVIKVDEVAQLWFIIPPPKQYLSEFETTFNCRMIFYRKGMNYHMKIDGKAHIVHDPEDVNNLIDLPEDAKYKAVTRQGVLIRVRIMYVHYFESREANTASWVERLKDLFNQWVYNQRPGYRPYRLQSEPIAA